MSETDVCQYKLKAAVGRSGALNVRVDVYALAITHFLYVLIGFTFTDTWPLYTQQGYDVVSPSAAQNLKNYATCLKRLVSNWLKPDLRITRILRCQSPKKFKTLTKKGVSPS